MFTPQTRTKGVFHGCVFSEMCFQSSNEVSPKSKTNCEAKPGDRCLNRNVLPLGNISSLVLSFMVVLTGQEKMTFDILFLSKALIQHDFKRHILAPSTWKCMSDVLPWWWEGQSTATSDSELLICFLLEEVSLAGRQEQYMKAGWERKSVKRE